MTVTFYITRHGETQFNVENRVQGWCDSPLTAKGIYDAYKLGQGLAGVDFVAQAQQVLLVPQTERNGIRRAVLVLTADPVSRKQVVVTYADISRCVFHFLLKFGHRAHVVVVVLIVVVRVTVVHIHVPRAPLYALFFGDCLALNSE